MSSAATCILCGESLSAASEDHETIGPLFCEKHSLDVQRLGVIGFPNLPDQFYAPVQEISREIRGRIVERVWLSEKPYALTLQFTGEGVLILFPHAHRTTFAQYVPASAISKEASLGCQLSAGDAYKDEPGMAKLLDMVEKKVPVVNLEYGTNEQGEELRDIVTIRFEGDVLVDFESTGWSFYSESFATELSLSWRGEQSPTH